MLIILPPSETKRPPASSGAPVDFDGLSFPELGPMRRRVLEALTSTSAGLDAFHRLGVRPSRATEVIRNTHLGDVPASPVLDVYAGPLYAGLSPLTLGEAAAARAARTVVVNSALWGALRPPDRIPPYRLHVCAHLVGMDSLEPAWREVLPGVLATAAGEAGVIVDLRSRTYQATGMPAGRGPRTAVLRVDQGPRGARIGDVVAKRVRGEAARYLLESGEDPEDPPALASVLDSRWPVRLDPPDRHGRPWTLTISTD